MKHPHTPLAILIIGAMASAGLSTLTAQTDSGQQPVVITPPAVQDGSNWSRAPFPAKRRFDDVKAPDGQAIDNLPPNTPATNQEPPIPAPTVAILQPAQPVSAPAVAVVTTETPALAPTGRVNVTVASSLDAATYSPTIRVATFANREQVLADIESRIAASEQAMSALGANTSSEFRRASDDAKSKAKALRNSLQKARNVSENDWNKMSAQIASDYDVYAAALARIDSAAMR